MKADAIHRAEAEIARVLADLERETGSLVETLDLEDLDVTQLGNDRQQVLRRPVIRMRRMPGSEWAV